MGQQDLANRWTFPLPLGTWELAAGQECSGQNFQVRTALFMCCLAVPGLPAFGGGRATFLASPMSAISFRRRLFRGAFPL